MQEATQSLFWPSTVNGVNCSIEAGDRGWRGDHIWLAPTIITASYYALHTLLRMCLAAKLGQDLLKHCPQANLKETVCKSFETISVTTALVMTTVAGLLISVQEIAPNGFCLDPLSLMHAKRAYVTLCLICIRACVQTVLYCVINLFYVNSFTDEDTVQFMKGQAAAMGATAITLAESYTLFGLVIMVWVGPSYGLELFLIALVGVVHLLFSVLRHWRSQFSPSYESLGKSPRFAEVRTSDCSEESEGI